MRVKASRSFEGSRDYIQGDIFPCLGAGGLVIFLLCFIGNVHILSRFLSMKPDTKADTKRDACNVFCAPDDVNNPVFSGTSRWC